MIDHSIVSVLWIVDWLVCCLSLIGWLRKIDFHLYKISFLCPISLLFVFSEGKPEPEKIFVPVPIPIYCPTPLAMYSLPIPTVLPVPVPIPIPIFIPTTKKNANSILKQIKVSVVCLVRWGRKIKVLEVLFSKVFFNEF